MYKLIKFKEKQKLLPEGHYRSKSSHKGLQEDFSSVELLIKTFMEKEYILDPNFSILMKKLNELCQKYEFRELKKLELSQAHTLIYLSVYSRFSKDNLRQHVTDEASYLI